LIFFLFFLLCFLFNFVFLFNLRYGYGILWQWRLSDADKKENTGRWEIHRICLPIHHFILFFCLLGGIFWHYTFLTNRGNRACIKKLTMFCIYIMVIITLSL
jgi:hypothetical protein